MRVLIAYTSRYGQTQKISEHIAHILRIHGAEARACEVDSLPRDIRVNAFDVVVLAGPVYFGRHPKKLIEFASEHRVALSKVRSAFVSVSGAAGGNRPEAEAAANAFLEQTQWTPDRVELVAGGEPFTRWGFFTRWMMFFKIRRMGRDVDPRRDYEQTDWDAVDRFAYALAGRTDDVRDPDLALM